MTRRVVKPPLDVDYGEHIHISVAIRDVPANVIALGNPARVVKNIRPGSRADDGTRLS